MQILMSCPWLGFQAALLQCQSINQNTTTRTELSLMRSVDHRAQLDCRTLFAATRLFHLGSEKNHFHIQKKGKLINISHYEMNE